MDNESRKKLNNTLHRLDSLDYIHPEDIPNIDLYMDQVLTFLNQQLGDLSDTTDEKPITKTMINNYSKNQILPPPEKKKYSRDHMLNLIFIYYMKTFLPMKDIKEILDPVNEKYFGAKEGRDFFDIYKEIVGMESIVAKELVKDVIKKYSRSRQAFLDSDSEDIEELQNFSFISMLSFDVFIKKMIIQEFISDQNKSEETTE